MMRAILLPLLAVCLAACGRPGDRVLFLRSDGADLPILVRGPASSSKLVVFVHGGPGGSGLVYASAMPGAFDPISERVLVAFYDQRGAGSAQGNVAAAGLTLERHVRDLEDVLGLLAEDYPQVTEVFLLGHSWGAALTGAYLSDPSRAANLAGWINVAGATRFPRMLELSRAWAIERAAEMLLEERDEARWRDILTWYERRPVLDKGNLIEHIGHVDRLGGTTHDPARASSRLTDALFFSPYSAGAEARNIGFSQSAMADELMALDIHPGLAEVQIPALFLFGAHDGRVPLTFGLEAFAALGTPADRKTFVRFERSGHRPFHEEPEEFARAVVDFVTAAR